MMIHDWCPKWMCRIMHIAKFLHVVRWNGTGIRIIQICHNDNWCNRIDRCFALIRDHTQPHIIKLYLILYQTVCHCTMNNFRLYSTQTGLTLDGYWTSRLKIQLNTLHTTNKWLIEFRIYNELCCSCNEKQCKTEKKEKNRKQRLNRLR